MLEAVISILGAIVMAVLAWAFNLNSEVKVQKQAKEDLKELINSKFDAMKELSEAIKDQMNFRFDSQGQRLDRIERSMNGHLEKN